MSPGQKNAALRGRRGVRGWLKVDQLGTFVKKFHKWPAGKPGRIATDSAKAADYTGEVDDELETCPFLALVLRQKQWRILPADAPPKRPREGGPGRERTRDGSTGICSSVSRRTAGR